MHLLQMTAALPGALSWSELAAAGGTLGLLWAVLRFLVRPHLVERVKAVNAADLQGLRDNHNALSARVTRVEHAIIAIPQSMKVLGEKLELNARATDRLSESQDRTTESLQKLHLMVGELRGHAQRDE